MIPGKNKLAHTNPPQSKDQPPRLTENNLRMLQETQSQGSHQSLLSSADVPELNECGIDQMGINIMDGASKKTVAVFELGQELAGRHAELPRNKRKRSEGSAASPLSSSSSQDGHQMRIRGPKLITDKETFLSGYALVRESRKLTEARNEQLRLMVLSQIYDYQLKQLSAIESQDSSSKQISLTSPATGSNLDHAKDSRTSQKTELPLRRSKRRAECMKTKSS